MSPSPRTHLALAAAALTAVCLGGVAAAAFAGCAPSWVASAVALAFVPYALLVRDAAALDDPRFVRVTLALAVLAGVALVAAPSVLSDDLFRYLWDARVASHGIDPYRFAPSDPALAGLRDALHARVNHPGIPTIYPPVAQLVFLVANAVAHAPWSVKAVALAAHLGTALVVGRVAGRRVPGATHIYVLNPLALSEAALGGHVDAVAALCIALFVWALVRGRSYLAALFAAAASGVKLVGIALAPIVFGRDRRAGALAIGLAALALVPLVGAGSGSHAPSGLGRYAQGWEGNAGAFALVRAGCQAVATALGPATGASPGHIRLEALRPLLERAEGTPFDPRAAVLAEKKGRGDPADFEAAYVGRLAARALVALAVLALAVVLAVKRTEPVLAARWIVLALLLLAPEVQPWYLLWLLPLEVAAGRVAGLVWSASVLVAYAPLDGWLTARRWHEPLLARVLEYGLLLAVIAFEELPRLRAEHVRA